MADITSDATEMLGHFEPGSEAAEFVKACTIAAGQLMQLLQGQWGHPDSLAARIDSLSARIDHLDERINVLQDTLENTIRTTGSVFEALMRLEPESDR